MKFSPRTAPHISNTESTRGIMINVILAMLVLYGMAYFYYGIRAILLGVVGVITALLCEGVGQLIFKKKINIHDHSAVVTGMMLPLMLPASIPFYVPVVAIVFSIFVVKQPFGGTGHNIFNPAAAGYAFALSCFSAEVMFRYPMPGSAVPLNAKDIIAVVSPALSLNITGVPQYDKVSMLLGNAPGPMGATNILALLACLAFLLLVRTVRWEIPVCFLATTSLISLLFPRILAGPLSSLFYETTSGLLLFGAVLLLSDPVTTPKRSRSRIVYAVLCGIIVMVYRHVGRLEEGFPFALLLMNATVWGLDMLEEKRVAQLRRKRHGTITGS